MRDELVESSADGQHARAREAIERTASRERSRARLGDLSSELGELLLRVFLFDLEIGALAIERGELERRSASGPCRSGAEIAAREAGRSRRRGRWHGGEGTGHS